MLTPETREGRPGVLRVEARTDSEHLDAGAFAGDRVVQRGLKPAA